MSEGKVAAQCCHAVIGLCCFDPKISIVVLKVSDKKYYEQVDVLERKLRAEFYRVFDAGYTEIDPGTETCLSFYE